MNVMQTLSDFKQNLHRSTSPAAARPAASAASASPAAASSSNSGSTTITANDFLQLLVAEMKNQDPTANQDPNAYIDQLVQVNSLQQLISINQDLSPLPRPSGSSTGSVVRAAQLGTAEGSAAASVASSLTAKKALTGPLPAATESTAVSAGTEDQGFTGLLNAIQAASTVLP